MLIQTIYIPELVLYLIISAFNIVIVDRLIKTLFKEAISQKIIIVLLYILFYVLTTTFSLIFRNMWLNFAVLLVSYLLLSMAYQEVLKSRVQKVLIIFVLSIVAEVIVRFMMRSITLQTTGVLDPVFIATYVGSRLIFFSMVLYFEKIRDLRQGDNISTDLWLLIFIIPLGSILLTLVLYYSNITRSSVYYSTVFVMFLNVFVFYLYDRQSDYYKQTLDQELYKSQNEAYQTQLELMQDSLDGVRSIKHDIKNHIIAIEALNNSGLQAELNQYIRELTKSVEPRQMMNTGDTTINSILNYKIDQVERLGHILQLDVSLPKGLELNAFDVSTIIGNVLDNSIEALEIFADKKKIQFSIHYDRGVLLIRSINPFDPKYDKKINKNHFGQGLKNVERIVDKYNGILTIDTTNNVFDIKVLLYV